MLDAQPVLESVPSTGRNLERARRQDLEDKIKGEKDWRHKHLGGDGNGSEDT